MTHNVVPHLQCFFIILILPLFLFPCLSYAGGYVITDEENRIISEGSEKNIIIGPTEKTVVFHDSGDRKVFDILWDASEKSLIIKGDHVHMKIYSDGKMATWKRTDSEKELSPVLIQPIVPVYPGKESR